MIRQDKTITRHSQPQDNHKQEDTNTRQGKARQAKQDKTSQAKQRTIQHNTKRLTVTMGRKFCGEERLDQNTTETRLTNTLGKNAHNKPNPPH